MQYPLLPLYLCPFGGGARLATGAIQVELVEAEGEPQWFRVLKHDDGRDKHLAVKRMPWDSINRLRERLQEVRPRLHTKRSTFFVFGCLARECEVTDCATALGEERAAPCFSGVYSRISR